MRRGSAETLKLVLYAGAVIAASFMTTAWPLALLLFMTFAVCGRALPRIVKRALFSVLAFNSVVSLTYLISSWLLHGRIPWDWLLVVNLRVYCLTVMTFALTEKTRLFEAFHFSRALSFTLTLAMSQTLIFRRTLREFSDALRSRTLARIHPREVIRQRAAMSSCFLRQALHNGNEISLAMRSRGVFND